jgi:hypothetical protein
MDDVTVNSNRKPRPQSTADKKELSIPSYIIQTLIGICYLCLDYNPDLLAAVKNITVTTYTRRISIQTL